ncbi:hypothetical protein GCM10012285_38170 [Streptomyces kronopolitis]|uniref:Uncharacterized protein n=1 Tax=Streptomyces kronopolitis TaxID=1612435 RepID=A0ABQ2JKQ4_9ACTN|nr:hypothetical protein GCM10012285_38170 [Streptomyces kronopolitis]
MDGAGGVGGGLGRARLEADGGQGDRADGGGSREKLPVSAQRASFRGGLHVDDGPMPTPEPDVTRRTVHMAEDSTP